MTIKDLFETLDYSSYDGIIVHWPVNIDFDDDYHSVSFDYGDAVIDVFGDIEIMNMQETSEDNKGDASLFIRYEKDRTNIHIYLKRTDIVSRS